MAWVAAIAAIAGVGSSIAQGEQQRKAARRNQEDQKRTQSIAETQASQEMQAQEQALRRANPKTPDIASLLTGRGRTGSPTLLSGASPPPTPVSRPTLLGQ